jgi:predicted nucleotidyltransferase
MRTSEALQRITAALDQSDVAYMLTGSFASAYYGTLRSTQDIDIVVESTPPQLRAFVESLPVDQYYSDVDAALEARQAESMFNVIDRSTGWKIDFIIRKSRLFSQEEFRRRVRVDLQGVSVFLASAEDVVIAKLEWAKLAQSQRQIEDVAGILKIRRDSLDRQYLKKWIRELSLTVEWIAVGKLFEDPNH